MEWRRHWPGRSHQCSVCIHLEPARHQICFNQQNHREYSSGLKLYSYSMFSFSSASCNFHPFQGLDIIHHPFSSRNEPHDLPQGTAPWAASVQAAVNAIRAAGATSQIILIPGSSYSSAQMLPTEAGPDLLKVTDPVGNASRLVFDGRQRTLQYGWTLSRLIILLQSTSTSTLTTVELTRTVSR